MNPPSVGLTFTVLFEEPFWVGVFERRGPEGYAVARVVFGPEPGPGEIESCVARELPRLRFSAPLAESGFKPHKVNPKRAQREAQHAASAPQLSTKAQAALQADLELRKLERKEHSREKRDAEAQRKFDLKQAKRKAKHRGH